MPVSSFFGLQTTLRGLIAQQRMLDTTGHNIANAATVGYSRQEATLAATRALQITVSGSINQVGAHLGAGVDVTGFRRIRDQFLDAQYRAQNTSLNDWKARAEALDSAELSLAEPGENGISAQLTKFWQAWSDLSNAPNDEAAKQAVVQQAQGLMDSIHSVRAQMVMAQEGAMGQYDQIAQPGGEVSQIATELAELNKVISQHLVHGDAPNDLMDRRDVLLDKLSGYGQISVEQLAGGSLNVAFVDATTGTAYPIVSDQTAEWAGPPAGGWSPGGQMGALLAVAKPGGMIDGYLDSIDSLADNLATAVNGAYGGTFFTTGAPAGATIAVAAPIQANPASITSGTGGPGSNDLALAIAQLQGNAGIDGAYKAFVAKVGGDLNETTRMQTNAQILTDSVENRRQSVAGVSMDEEMSNLVRFQRAYQASARAMSTMDEMLDVLINRTGRVGL
jgi:flagellar hook-associated protein 1 FlgK